MPLPEELKALLSSTVSLKRVETERARTKHQREQETHSVDAASTAYEALWVFSLSQEVNALRLALQQLELQELVLEAWGTRAVVLRAAGAPLGVRRYGSSIGMLDPSVATLSQLQREVPPEVATRLAAALSSGTLWERVHRAVEAHRRALERLETR